MSLNSVLNDAAAERIAQLEPGDVDLIIKSAALGLRAEQIFEGAKAVAEGKEYSLPRTLGTPRPLVINAWSFVNDHGQYADTYGLTDAEAGAVKTLLRTEVDKGIAEITRIVTGALAKRGSTRAVRVTKDGMPGTGPADSSQGPRRSGGADLKAEINRTPQIYGMYRFVAEDSGRPGSYRFRVALGGGLYATFPSKVGAIDVARICRVNGRDHPLIEGRVVFWRDGRAPLSGPDIPESATFDGRLKPGETPPPNPVDVAKTVAGRA